MGRVLRFALVVLLAFSAYADDPLATWARERAVPVDAFRTLDREIATARLIGVGESVPETEPFLSFRVKLFKELVKRHKVTALVLESGLPEVMAADDYVRGRASTIDFSDRALVEAGRRKVRRVAGGDEARARGEREPARRSRDDE